MKLYVLIPGVLLVLSLLLVACGESASPSSEATSTPPVTLTEEHVPTARPTPTAASPFRARSTTTDTPTPAASFRLTILHNNDGESQLVNLEVWPESHWPGFALRQSDVFQSYAAQ